MGETNLLKNAGFKHETCQFESRERIPGWENEKVSSEIYDLKIY